MAEAENTKCRSVRFGEIVAVAKNVRTQIYTNIQNYKEYTYTNIQNCKDGTHKYTQEYKTAKGVRKKIKRVYKKMQRTTNRK